MIQKRQKKLVIGAMDIHVLTSIIARKPYILRKQEKYFLYGEGGALTEYARSVCGGSTGGSRIIPMTEEGAKNWAMEHLECDEYEALFGEVEE